MKLKRCTSCKEQKPTSEFHKMGPGKYGVASICKNCRAEKQKNGGAPKEHFHCETADNEQVITAVSKTIRTLEAAIAYAKVDLAIWKIARFTLNKWDQGAKLSRDGEDRMAAMELWQVKIWLERKVSVVEEEGCKLLLEKMKKFSPKYRKVRVSKISDPHLLEISINDVHFAKLAWARETGENYDLNIARALYPAAVKNLVAKSAGFPIDKILLPVGNDFFHVDGPGNMTANGTPQDTDGRYVKMFEAGQSAVIEAIDYLQQIAPVEVVWVRGNHDATSSWHLAHTIKAWFRLCNRVKVNDEPSQRKYVSYGNTLIGLTHGDEEKHLSLPNIMATEVPAMWANSRFREWHLGHFHKRKETHFVGTDTYEGVVVRICGSISGRDAWHARKGYMGTRAADAFLYSKQNGPVGYFSANVSGENSVM